MCNEPVVIGVEDASFHLFGDGGDIKKSSFHVLDTIVALLFKNCTNNE